jgi:hypothetical protein
MNEAMKAKTETTRAAHNMGHLPLAPRRVKPKPLDPANPPASGDAKAPDWAETLIEWVRDAADRGAYLRHRPIARDETGRAYHILGGASGAAMLFVQDPTPEERARREAGADSDDEAAAPSAKKPKTEGATEIAAEIATDPETPEARKPREDPAARASRVAAEARASIKRGRKENDALGKLATSMDVWPTRWGVFEVGPKMKSLKEWLDDDPRNPAFADERRLKSISALLMKTAAKPAPFLPAAKDEGKDAVKDEGKDAVKDSEGMSRWPPSRMPRRRRTRTRRHERTPTRTFSVCAATGTRRWTRRATRSSRHARPGTRTPGPARATTPRQRCAR